MSQTVQLAVELPTGETAAEEQYRCVHRWIPARRANWHSEEMALRRVLQAGHPCLFQILKRSVREQKLLNRTDIGATTKNANRGAALARTPAASSTSVHALLLNCDP
jgi:hypothetical protein